MANEIVIDGKAYALVADSLMPTGKRALSRSFRATNGTDPSRLSKATWEFTNIGFSLESTAGGLATDYTQNLETRYPRRLFSLGKRNAVDIATSNVTDSGGYAAFAYGSPSSAYGGTEALYGTSDTSGDIVNFFDEQQSKLFVHHGAISTQVEMVGWTSEEAYIHQNIIMDAIDWRTFGWIAFGPGKAVAQRTNVTSTGSTYTDVGAVGGQYARKFAIGGDKLWVATGVNQMTYTNNAYTTFATAFEAGDHDHLANGLGTLGPYTFIGKQGGIYSFTDQAKPVPLSKALEHFISTLNGAQWADPGWGWLYYTSAIGLRAINLSLVDNPVGPGERMLDYTGPVGTPTALWTHRGELFVAYLQSDDSTYIWRGVFSDETPGTGQPKFYPFRYIASTQCNRGFASASPTNPVIIWGEDGDIAYEEVDPLGRDDLWSARKYSMSGGVWWGTTLDRNPLLLKTLRLARMRVLNVEECSTWQLAVAYDVEPWHTPTYFDVGPELDVPGYYTLRPTQGTAPLPPTALSGRNLKPRLTQTAEGVHAETLPPEVNGVLEIEYDERPEFIEEIVAVFQARGVLSMDETATELRELASIQTAGPVKARIDNRDCYVMVADVQKRADLKGDAVEGVQTVLHVWETE